MKTLRIRKEKMPDVDVTTPHVVAALMRVIGGDKRFNISIEGCFVTPFPPAAASEANRGVQVFETAPLVYAALRWDYDKSSAHYLALYFAAREFVDFAPPAARGELRQQFNIAEALRAAGHAPDEAWGFFLVDQLPDVWQKAGSARGGDLCYTLKSERAAPDIAVVTERGWVFGRLYERRTAYILDASAPSP